MITAKFDIDKDSGAMIMRVSGHAGAGPQGFDLVCAGVSSIAVGIAQVISDMDKMGKFKRESKISIRNGFVRVIAKPKPGYEAETLHTFFVGEVQLGMMAQVYPKYIKIKPFDSPDTGVSE